MTHGATGSRSTSQWSMRPPRFAMGRHHRRSFPEDINSSHSASPLAEKRSRGAPSTGEILVEI